MRLIKEKTLADCAATHPDARPSLQSFVGIARVANWRSMDDIVKHAPFAPSPVGDDRVVFNISGNRYRLICAIDFGRGVLYVKWFGRHADYDRIDAKTASQF